MALTPELPASKNNPSIDSSGRRSVPARALTNATSVVRFYDARQGTVIQKRARVVNVSESGAALETEEIARLPSRFEVEIFFPDAIIPLKGTYEVRWFQSDISRPLILYGLKLLSMSPSEFLVLQAYLTKRLQIELEKPHAVSNFESGPTSSIKSLKKGKGIRQERLSLIDDVIHVHFQGQRFAVVDLSSFGVALRVHPSASFDIGEVVSAELRLGDFPIRPLDLKPVRKEPHSPGANKLAFEIVGKPLDMEMVEAMRSAANMILHQSQRTTRRNQIPAKIRHEVLETKDFLQRLEKEINDIAQQTPRTGYRATEAFETAICAVVSQHLGQHLTPLHDRLMEMLEQVKEPERSSIFEFVREELQGLLFQAPFAFRSYTKPLGYAGDYEMMNLIYRDQPEGSTLFAKCLHRYFINQPAACAVRNRVSYIQSHLNDLMAHVRKGSCSLRVASLASGPAFEMEKWIESFYSSEGVALDISLLDQDLDSLRHAQRRLLGIARSRSLPVQVNCHQKSVRNVIAAGFPSRQMDLVYSLGLFDYLSDNVCRAVGEKMFEALRPGGRLVIGNFNINNPTRNIMELTLDWKLIHRSVSDMQKLFGHLSDRIRVDRESEDVNLFCVVEKPSK